MKAMLIKDHYYSGTPITELLKQTHKHIPVKLLSGVPLNNATGGFNKHAVDHGIKLGANMVWMPTFASKNHCDHHKAPWDSKGLLPPDPLTPIDANGKLKDEVKPILDMIAEANIVLSGGHLHISEIYVVFEEAIKRGVKKLIVNHPTFLIGCTPEDITRLVQIGAYIEHSFCMFIPSIKKGKPGRFTAEDLEVLIKAASVDRTILASDLGQVGNDRPVQRVQGVDRPVHRSRLFGRRYPQDDLDQRRDAVRYRSELDRSRIRFLTPPPHRGGVFISTPSISGPFGGI